MSKTPPPPSAETYASPTMPSSSTPPSQRRGLGGGGLSRREASRRAEAGNWVSTSPLAGEDAWQSVAQQIKSFRTQQEESQRAFALLAEEQAAFLMELDVFVNSQIQARPQWNSFSRVQSQPCGDRAELPMGSCKNAPALQPVASVQSAEPFAVQSAGSADENGVAGDETFTPREASRVAGIDTTYSMVPIDVLNMVKTKTIEDGLLAIPPVEDGVYAWSRAVGYRILAWHFFEPLMGLVIALNATNIGWMIDKELRQQPVEVHEILEHVFLVIFLLEMSLRLYVHRLDFFKVKMNTFDFLILTFNVVVIIIYPILTATGGEDAVQLLQQVMVLRMMRLLRLARAVRLVASFRGLWKLVQGLMHSFGTMVSAMVLLFIIMFIFACFGAEFITKQNLNDSEVGGIVAQKFSSLPMILLTLFQFISMDSTASFYVPLIERKPGLVIYFLLLLVIVTITLMNLVTALLVEDAISSSQMDEEMKTHYTRERLKQLRPHLQDLFRSLDRSGGGCIQAKDVMNSIKQGIRIPIELQEFISPARMLDLFEALDADHSGDLTEFEFVDGLACVALADVPIETMQILYLLRSLRKELRSGRGRVGTGRHHSEFGGSRETVGLGFNVNGAASIAMQQLARRPKSIRATRSRTDEMIAAGEQRPRATAGTFAAGAGPRPGHSGDKDHHGGNGGGSGAFGEHSSLVGEAGFLGEQPPPSGRMRSHKRVTIDPNARGSAPEDLSI